ncbi:MAG: LacI family DNA-binding transcriptional regulator [Lachnospiraceae bacterium]|nr:LacI family DNA-binding transcriptional regulator [Lachnospiraceae bacterium]
MRKSVRLADIAEPLGVSTVTVSKALSGQKGVSDEMREKIVALADELGYRQPSAVKKSLSEGSYNIGVLMHEKYFDKYASFYMQIYQQINVKAGLKNSFTLLETVNSDMERALEMPKIIQEKKVQGFIVIGRLDDKYIKHLEKSSNMPVIYVDFFSDTNKCDAVISDNFYGAYTLTSYLIEKGHRDIAYVGTVLSTASITDRYLGYVKALMENGIAIRDDWKIDDRHIETGKVDEERLIKLPEDMPTAFFCNCDLVASMLIRKLQNEGYRVPEDISVVGYDNYLYPGLCNVNITTYEVDIKEMARKAVDNLIDKIKGIKGRESVSIIEGHLVEKDSVKNLVL